MPSRKKSKTSEPEPELEASSDDEEPTTTRADEEEEEEEQEEQEEQEEEQEQEDEGNDPNAETKKKKRRRAVARRKGYRLLATKGGFPTSTAVAALDPSRDVTRNILSLAEVARAAKWCPQIAEHVTYGTGNEFEERLMLSQEPLARGPQAVIRASAEVFARKIVNDAMVRTFEAGKTRISLNAMVSALSPMDSALHFEFMRPTGLLRHAQTTTMGSNDKAAPALGVHATDEMQMMGEKENVVAQKQLFKKVTKEADARREARSAKRKASLEKRAAATTEATAKA